MRKHLLSLFMLLAVIAGTACTFNGASPRPLNPPFTPAPPPDAPQEYRQGWLDGCETGFGAHGLDVYRTNYKFTQNPSLVMNPVYYKAWKDAENYCRTYIFEYSYRAMVPWCSLDGITDDCSDNTGYNSVPFLGKSTEDLGYTGSGGNTGVGSLLGGGDSGMGGFLGGPEDGVSGVTGWGGIPAMQGTF